ncbi:MAG: DUF2946 domain-containing protein [Hyphomicrobium sp.]|nr:MAG: DUF2946 domain-containing protein [Hyphomicrobium sp.]
MGWNIWAARHSRISAAFALLSVVFYASLLPNHLVSELNHFLFAADYGTFADVICKSGKSSDSVPPGKAPSCPFCKGLAAFQLALTEAQPAIRPLMLTGQKIEPSAAALLAITFLITARSRGPPLLD